MRISELSQRSAVSVASIKYYLREGLLMPGERTSRTQAEYGDDHLRRLRLVRALIDVGGLSVERSRAVIAQLEAGGVALDDAYATALSGDDPGPQPDLDDAEALVADLGWDLPGDLPQMRRLARALTGTSAAEFSIPREQLLALGRAMDTVAELEIAGTPTGDAEAAVRYAVLGTVLMRPVLLALREVAHVRHSLAGRRADAPPKRRRRT